MSKAASAERHQQRTLNKFGRLLLSVHDFQQALSAAVFLLEEAEERGRYPLGTLRRFRCFETALVVAYARPFSQAKGEIGRLEWKDLGLKLEGAELQLHRRLIERRNRLHAHSDADMVNMGIYEYDGKMTVHFDEQLRFTEAEVLQVKALCEILIQTSAARCRALGKQLNFADFDMSIIEAGHMDGDGGTWFPAR